jgi:hypothetical protein
MLCQRKWILYGCQIGTKCPVMNAKQDELHPDGCARAAPYLLCQRHRQLGVSPACDQSAGAFHAQEDVPGDVELRAQCGRSRLGAAARRGSRLSERLCRQLREPAAGVAALVVWSACSGFRVWGLGFEHQGIPKRWQGLFLITAFAN